jgi:hypothetical protein
LYFALQKSGTEQLVRAEPHQFPDKAIAWSLFRSVTSTDVEDDSDQHAEESDPLVAGVRAAFDHLGVLHGRLQIVVDEQRGRFPHVVQPTAKVLGVLSSWKGQVEIPRVDLIHEGETGSLLGGSE